MKKLLIVVSVLFVIWLVLPTQQMRSQHADDLNDFVPAIMEEAAIPGIAIAVIKDGKAELITGYGFANVAERRAVTLDTPFNIASISKPLLGIVLLQLVDQGVLELDRNINDYLPFVVDNPHVEQEVITVRHLATHTAGIADFYDEATYAENRDTALSLEDHLKSLLLPAGLRYENGAHYLPYRPGEHREYSNLAAGLAGYLVQAITGESLAEYSKRAIFSPLKMRHTSWLLADMNLADIAVPYEVEQCVPFTPICSDTESPKTNFIIAKVFNPPFADKHFRAYPHFGNPQYPDGGVRTSINDLTTLFVALLNQGTSANHDLLTMATYKEMFRLQLPSHISTNQRFFWRDNKQGFTGHSGSDLGVYTTAYFDVERKNAVVILMNRGVDAAAENAMTKIFDRLLLAYRIEQPVQTVNAS